MLETFGEVGTFVPLQLSQRSYCAKTEKKVIAKIQCEKHKKLSLVVTLLIWVKLINTSKEKSLICEN